MLARSDRAYVLHDLPNDLPAHIGCALRECVETSWKDQAQTTVSLFCHECTASLINLRFRFRFKFYMSCLSPLSAVGILPKGPSGRRNPASCGDSPHREAIVEIQRSGTARARYGDGDQKCFHCPMLKRTAPLTQFVQL